MSIIQNGSQKAIFRISNANPQKPYLEKGQISDCLKNFSNFVNRTKLSYSTMCFSQRSFWPNGVMDSWTRIWSSNFEPGNFLWEKFDDFCCVVEEKDSGWLCGLADLRFQQDVSLEKYNMSIQDQSYFGKVVRSPNFGRRIWYLSDFLRVALFSVWLVSSSG